MSNRTFYLAATDLGVIPCSTPQLTTQLSSLYPSIPACHVCPVHSPHDDGLPSDTALHHPLLPLSASHMAASRARLPAHTNLLRRREKYTSLYSAHAVGRQLKEGIAAFEKKYTEDHEWIEIGSDGKTGTLHSPLSLFCLPLTRIQGTIGISTYAAKALGDVVFVELPTADLEVNKGETIGAVESVKSASDILSPVSGRITEANSVLEEKPGTINASPEGDGWLARIELSDVSETEGLMDSQAYTKFTEEAEEH